MTYNETLEMNEFILKLPQEHKIIFLRALFFLANIDGTRDENEIKYIINAAKHYKLENSGKLFLPASEQEILDELKQITDRRICLELVKEMCMLGHADNDLSDEETLFIGHAGLTMGVELEKIEQISNWVIDRIIWLEQGKIIFEEY